MIYICIPTHNEQQTVGVVLWKLRQVLTEFPRDYQLLVADDASTDRTPDVLEPYTRVLPLTVVRSERRLGQAASLEMLLREAVRRSEYPKRDIVITLQADFSEEPDDIVPMIKRVEAGADVVVGNKVSAAKPGRAWRFARALGSFFSRSQQWPEGVVTPFEGYRAYRLYSIKRAVDDRNGHRLLRYDGWAGHAELLRAVLPHARRIEALDVEDRPDRLQRPRRERPFAAAMQVRPMMKGVAPPGLVDVAELDRMAATGSRSRDRAVGASRTAAARPEQERGNGRGRPRGEAQRRRERDGQPPRERNERGRSDAPRPPRQARTENAPAARSEKSGERPGRPPRSRRKPADPAAAVAEPTAEATSPLAPMSDAAAENAATIAVDPDPAATGEARPRKRRRRRRSKTSTAGTTPESQAEDSGSEAEENAGTVGDEDGERIDAAEGSSEAGARKRRRRRGGRGRRRGAKPGQSDTDGGSVTTLASELTAQPAAAEPAAVPAPAPAPPTTQTEA